MGDFNHPTVSGAPPYLQEAVRGSQHVRGVDGAVVGIVRDVGMRVDVFLKPTA